MRAKVRTLETEDQKKRTEIANALFGLHNTINIIIGNSVEKIMTGDDIDEAICEAADSILTATKETVAVTVDL